MIVIRHLVSKDAPIDGPLSQIIMIIFHLIKYFEEVKCHHALRILNFLTNSNANLDCNLIQGKLIHGGEFGSNIYAIECIRESKSDPLLRGIMPRGGLEPN